MSFVGHQPPPIFKRGPAPTARLFAFVTVCLVLLVADLRFRYLEVMRDALSVVTYPVQMAALVPRRLALLAQQRGRLVLIEPSREPEPASFGAVIRSGESQPVNWLLEIVREVGSRL